MTPPDGQRCETCRFWTNYNSNGTCQRHAPTMKLPQSHPERGIWPWTNSGEWCGDWQAKVEKPQRPRGYLGIDL